VPQRFGNDVDPRERLPVAWYAPPVLWQAGQELVQSQTFLRNLDRRESFSPVLAPIDLSARDDGALWLDFIADTGDGGRSTSAVARAALAARLSAADADGRRLDFPEADVLLLGGDLAYPGASSAVYQYRLLEPFTLALDPNSRFAQSAPRVQKVVAAIPQNHDWFDSASTFCRYFVAQDRGDFLGARTPQRQTYFAMRLPHRFWVLGFDWALTGDLDRQQFEAFRALLDSTRDDGIRSGDELLLIYPEPYWTRALGDGASDGYPCRYQRLEALFEAQGAHIGARLAGDLHHYRRETLEADRGGPTHLVTCGTGGAFLHPTHTRDVAARKVLDRGEEARAVDPELRHRVRVGTGDASCGAEFAPQLAWPAPATTRALAWRNVFALFILRFARAPWRQGLKASAIDLWQSNLAFALALGVLYGINAYVNSFVFSRSFEPDGFAPMEQLGFLDGAIRWLRAMVFSPLGTGVNLAMIAACVRIAWEGPAHWSGRLLSGFLHAMAHGFAIFALYWAAAHAYAPWLASLGTIATLTGGLALWSTVAVAGVAVGGLLFGLYLALMSAVFGQLPNNAFGSLALERFKGFLRMRLTAAGLEVSMLGTERVDEAAIEWRVIDRFVVGAGRAAPAAQNGSFSSSEPGSVTSSGQSDSNISIPVRSS
jgi:hypothetical protein